MNVRTTLRNARRRHRSGQRLSLLVAALVIAAPAFADVVTDWNATADMASPALGHPIKGARMMAMVHIAIHDALNSIDGRYASYTVIPKSNPGASVDAAVAQAAYRVLLAVVPGQAGNFGPVYTSRINAVTCPAAHPTCKAEGIQAGNWAADAILALRANDGWNTPTAPYTVAPGPGIYQSTGPAPEFNGWAAQAKPFALHSAWQFRADPGEILDLGDVYARDYNETKTMGSAAVRAANPDSEPSKIARYWPGGGANWNFVAQAIVPRFHLDAWQHARLFALLNIAQADGGLAVMDTKYAYLFWRPLTAIRSGDSDGNPATTGDPAWQSYLPTPPYPDYVCGLTNASGAGTEVLRRYFGSDNLPYTVFAPGAGFSRSYPSLTAAANESISARVYGGMHFRSSCVAGVRQGEQVGRFIIQHYLKPL